MKRNPDYQFELVMRVRDYEVDSQGIVNNANYLHYMEHTRHEFCRAAGTSFRTMQERGIDPVLRKVEIEYLTPLRLGEEMVSRISTSCPVARLWPRPIYGWCVSRTVVSARVMCSPRLLLNIFDV